MAHFDIRNINYIIKGEKENLINLDIFDTRTSSMISNITYLTDTGNDTGNISSSSMTHRIIKTKEKDNKHISYNMLNPDNTIYALFDFKDVAVKSPLRKGFFEKSKFQTTDNEINTEYLLDIYGPKLSANPIGFCAAIGSDYNLVSYGITENISNSPMIKATNLSENKIKSLNNISADVDFKKWNYKIIEENNKTYIGIPVSSLFNLSDNISLSNESYSSYLSTFGSLSSNMISVLFDSKYNLSGLNKNYIYRIVLDSQYYNNHNSGDIMGDFVIGKNSYDAQYSMNMDSLNCLSNVRNYIGIGSCGGRVFLKYTDNTNLYNTSDSKLTTSISSDIQDIYLSSKVLNDKFNNFQKIEYIDSISQFKSSTFHKSNMFSIKIKNLFNNLDSNPEISKNISKIKDDLTRSIRKIVSDLAPAHTQLLDVLYINDSKASINLSSNFIDENIFIFEDVNTKDHIIGLTNRGKSYYILTIPKEVLEIENGALNQSTSVENFEVESSNKFFIQDEMLVKNDGDKKYIISFPVNNPSTKFIVSEDFTNIYSEAFNNCINLNTLFIPLSVSINNEKFDTLSNNLVVNDSKPIVYTYYSYLVKFIKDTTNNNTISGEMLPQKIYSNIPTTLRKNAFDKKGYTFANWISKLSNTFKDEESNTNGQFCDYYGEINLSAQWKPNIYSITYLVYSQYYPVEGNIYSQTLEYDIPTQLSSCQYSKFGYNFKNWDWLSSITSASFVSSFNDNQIVSNLTEINNNNLKFYANFDPITYFVKFINTSVDISANIPETLSCKFDTSYCLSNQYNIECSNISAYYKLFAWQNEQYIFRVPLYEDELSSKIPEMTFMNLTAIDESIIELSTQWTTRYTIEFNSNYDENKLSNELPISGVMDEQILYFGDNKRKLFKNTYELNTYRFKYWKDASGVIYNNEEMVHNLTNKPGDKFSLSVVWEPEYYVEFEKNGDDDDDSDVSGNMDTQQFFYNSSQQLLKCTFTKVGYEFKGWTLDKNRKNTDSDVNDEEITYKDSSFFVFDKQLGFELLESANKTKEERTIKLYAIWEPNTYYVKFNMNKN